MNSKEKKVLEGMRDDIRHDVADFEKFQKNEGGLNLEGLVYRVLRKAEALDELVKGTYPFDS